VVRCNLPRTRKVTFPLRLVTCCYQAPDCQNTEPKSLQLPNCLPKTAKALPVPTLQHAPSFPVLDSDLHSLPSHGTSLDFRFPVAPSSEPGVFNIKTTLAESLTD
jgi:hypothetical protein